MQRSKKPTFSTLGLSSYLSLSGFLLLSVVAASACNKKAVTPTGRSISQADACKAAPGSSSSFSDLAGKSVGLSLHPPKTDPASLALVDLKPETNEYGHAYTSVILNFENDIRADVLLWRVCELNNVQHCFPATAGQWEEASLGLVELPPLEDFAGKSVNFFAKPCLNSANAAKGSGASSIEEGYYCAAKASVRPFKMPDNRSKPMRKEIEAALLENYKIQYEEYKKVALEMKEVAQQAVADSSTGLRLSGEKTTADSEMLAVLKNIAETDSSSTVEYLQSLAKFYRGDITAEIATIEQRMSALQLAGTASNCAAQGQVSNNPTSDDPLGSGYASDTTGDSPVLGSGENEVASDRNEEADILGSKNKNSSTSPTSITSSDTTKSPEDSSNSDESGLSPQKDPGGKKDRKKKESVAPSLFILAGTAGLVLALYPLSNSLESAANYFSGDKALGSQFFAWKNRLLIRSTGLYMSDAENTLNKIKNAVNMPENEFKELIKNYNKQLETFKKNEIDKMLALEKTKTGADASADFKRKIQNEFEGRFTNIDADSIATINNTRYYTFDRQKNMALFDFDGQYAAKQKAIYEVEDGGRRGILSAVGLIGLSVAAIIIGDTLNLAQTDDTHMKKIKETGDKIITLQDRQEALKESIRKAVSADTSHLEEVP